MFKPSIKLSFCFFFIFLLTKTSVAKKKTNYPYNGSFVGDTLTFYHANFRNTKFDSVAYFKLAKFNRDAFFNDAKFDSEATFEDSKFIRIAYFAGATFLEHVILENTTFDSLVTFYQAKFYGLTEVQANFHKAYFGETEFYGETGFLNTIFYKEAFFGRAQFNNEIFFEETHFSDEANFKEVNFNGKASFEESAFNGIAYFQNAKFSRGVSFSGAVFEDLTLFQGANFNGRVNLSSTVFKKEVDFRRTNFDSVKTIYLENINFPVGKLHFYWEQFKGQDKLKIGIISKEEIKSRNKRLGLDTLEENNVRRKELTDSLKKDDFRRTDIIYKLLRDNFLEQGNESSADDVMYELGKQRDEILSEFHWHLYGIFFGYGYQPWRFLLFVLLPIIIFFAVIWYWFYYPSLVFISSNLFPEKFRIGSQEKHLIKIGNRSLIKIRITDFNKSPKTNNPLTRYWHALYFSTSVLLGIRFKKDWIKVFSEDVLGSKSYIRLVSFEWALGIILFVVFALLVKGVRFSFVKDLLGF